MRRIFLLIISVFASNEILVKIEEDDDANVQKKTSQYIGVTYIKRDKKWCAQRRSKSMMKVIRNGTYQYEQIAAHASDTLARKLMENGERTHILNFPNEISVVFPAEQKPSSTYIGVSYTKRDKRWCAQRHSKTENKLVHNGTYKDEETAAYASDTLAKQLMENGEKGHKMNFPYEDPEVFPETKTSKYFGVYYMKSRSRWYVQRHSKIAKKVVCYGSYKDEEAAAYASDTLARNLMANGEQNHKLNFSDDDTEEIYIIQKVFLEDQGNKRKIWEREDMDHSQNK